MNTNTILQDLISNAVLHGKYTVSGDHEKTNLAYSKVIEAMKKLYTTDPTFSSLDKLLEHEDDSVKIFSATELLFTDKKNKASEVLEKLSKENNLLAFTAGMVLSEWKKGNLKSLHSQ